MPKEDPIGEPEVSFAPNVKCVQVVQVMVDQEHIILYRNHVGLFYCTPSYPTQFYPFENVINVYQNLHGNPILLEDNHKNQFAIVTRDEMNTYIGEGIHVQYHVKRVTFDNLRRYPRSIASTRGNSIPRPDGVEPSW